MNRALLEQVSSNLLRLLNASSPVGVVLERGLQAIPSLLEQGLEYEVVARTSKWLADCAITGVTADSSRSSAMAPESTGARLVYFQETLQF